jgi:hypothetical protein
MSFPFSPASLSLPLGLAVVLGKELNKSSSEIAAEENFIL